MSFKFDNFHMKFLVYATSFIMPRIVVKSKSYLVVRLVQKEKSFLNSKTFFSATIPSYMTEGINRFDPGQIVGGQTAPSPIPWQVSVQKSGHHHCGGTIIDAYTVMSAAHCFDQNGYLPNGLTIRAGSTDKSSGGQVSIICHFSAIPIFLQFSFDLRRIKRNLKV